MGNIFFFLDIKRSKEKLLVFLKIVTQVFFFWERFLDFLGFPALSRAFEEKFQILKIFRSIASQVRLFFFIKFQIFSSVRSIFLDFLKQSRKIKQKKNCFRAIKKLFFLSEKNVLKQKKIFVIGGLSRKIFRL